MTTGTLRIYGRTLHTSRRMALCFTHGIIPLLVLSATYLGYLVASVFAAQLGWSTLPTALLLLVLTGQLRVKTASGAERDVSVLPPASRKLLIGAALAYTLWALMLDGRMLDFAVGAFWAINSVITALVLRHDARELAYGTKVSTALQFGRRHAVEDVAFKELAS